MALPTIIACSNQMGGAGKTTTSINISGALADRDREVLLVDLDPQGTATEGTGFTEHYNKEGLSLHEMLSDVDQQSNISRLICEHEEFDLIPAHIKMFKTEDELQNSPRTEERLQMALSNLDTEYDYIIVDCPPHLGPFTNNALIAATNVLIPAPAVRRSVRALETLGEQLSYLEKHYEIDITKLGVVISDVQYPLDGDTKQMLQWFENHFDGIGTYEIRNRVAIKRAWNQGLSIFAHDEECDMEDVYENLAGAIDRQIGAVSAEVEP
jgi:chromosome partitioning protein